VIELLDPSSSISRVHRSNDLLMYFHEIAIWIADKSYLEALLAE
jgi:hypothetical protein